MPFRWRPDGDYVRDVPNTRRIMPYIMRTRNESAVYFDQQIDTRKAYAFLSEFRARTGLKATLLHLILWATAQALHARPRLNRFAAGGRIFQRRGIWLSFSAKKGKSDDQPIVVIKRRIDPAWTFEELVRKIEGDVKEGRSDRRSGTDKELDLIFKLPSFIIWPLGWLVLLLDRIGLLPRFFIDGDPLFCSLFVANLGSIGMDSAYHHLYEYGNCPLFMAVGRQKDEVVPGPDGTPVIRPLTTFRYTLDERVEDGLYCLQSLELFRKTIEDPEAAGIDLTPPART